MRHAALTTVLAGAIASTACAQNEISGYYLDRDNFSYKVDGVPDFDQVRAASPRFGVDGLPNSGRFYCVPTSTVDLLAWISNKGWPVIPPFPEDWSQHTASNWNQAARSKYNDITGWIDLLGSSQYMRTTASRGTSPIRARRGLVRFLDDYDPIAADTFNIGYDIIDPQNWTAHIGYRAPEMYRAAWSGLRGAVMAVQWGYYEVDFVIEDNGTVPYLRERNGGHQVAVTGLYAHGDERLLTVANPATDRRGISQSDFREQRYRVIPVGFTTPNGNLQIREVVLRTNDNLPAEGTVEKLMILDGFLTILPREAFAVNNTLDGINYHTLQFDGSSTDVITDSFPAPAGETIIAGAKAYGGINSYTASLVDGTNLGKIRIHDRFNDSWEELLEVQDLNGMRRTRKESLLVSAGQFLHRVNPFDTANPIEITLDLGFTPIAFDVVQTDDEDLIAVLEPGRIVYYALEDMTYLRETYIGFDEQWEDATDLRISPIDGSAWVALQTDLRRIYDDGNGVGQIQHHPVSGVASSLSISELGDLFINTTREGQPVVYQFAYDDNLGQLVYQQTSPYADMLDIGRYFEVDRMESNADEAIFDLPESAMVDVELYADTFAPDEPRSPVTLCDEFEGFEFLGQDGDPVTQLQVNGVDATITTNSGDVMRIGTYGPDGESAFGGPDNELDTTFGLHPELGQHFITTVHNGNEGYLGVAEPITFELSQPVGSFAMTSIDVLEYNTEYNHAMNLRAYDADGNLVDELHRGRNQGPSGVVLHWQVDSVANDIVRVVFEGWHGQCCGGYALDNFAICFAPCKADFNGDDTVNTLDVLAFLNAWSSGDALADFNDDGNVNTLDVLAFLNLWSAGC